MYETINQELNIVSCRLADLKIGQVQNMLSQWEEGARIGSLTLFFEPEKDRVVLNADHQDYFLNREFVEAYLSADEESRNHLKNRIPEALKENVLVLDNCIRKREVHKEIDRAIRGAISPKEKEVLKEIRVKHTEGTNWISFMYGVMQGKRAERAKRKNRG